MRKESIVLSQCTCCSWDNPIWALSCPVTAMSTECPRISYNTHYSASLPVSAPLGQLFQRKQQNSVCSWVLQEVTHLQRQNTISRLFWNTASVCPCSKPRQVSDTHVLSPSSFVSTASPGGRVGTDRGRCVTWCHAYPTLRHCQEIRKKNHTKDFEWRNCKSRLPLQQKVNRKKPLNLNPLLPYTWHTEVKWIHQTDSYFIPTTVVNERWWEGTRINP